MKRGSKKSRQATKGKGAQKRPTNSSPDHAHEPPDRGRRDALLKVRDYGILVAVVGGAGWYGVDYFGRRFSEYDLTQIGNGTPSVVQIHDPGCPLCRELQRQTRTALGKFKKGELQYIVADIKTSAGRELAAAHGVGHVTLLLFDGQGERLDILSGSNTADFLEGAFRRHIQASAPAATS